MSVSASRTTKLEMARAFSIAFFALGAAGNWVADNHAFFSGGGGDGGGGSVYGAPLQRVEKQGVFVRWGHTRCPPRTKRLLRGFAAARAGSPVCLSGAPRGGTWLTGAEGAEDEARGSASSAPLAASLRALVIDGKAIACAICGARAEVYVQAGGAATAAAAGVGCAAAGHKLLFTGSLFSVRRFEPTVDSGAAVSCVDEARAAAPHAPRGHGAAWTPTESRLAGDGGPSHRRATPCVVCAAAAPAARPAHTQGSVYEVFGAPRCRAGAALLWSGLTVSTAHLHGGGGAVICLLPAVQAAPHSVGGGYGGGGGGGKDDDDDDAKAARKAKAADSAAAAGRADLLGAGEPGERVGLFRTRTRSTCAVCQAAADSTVATLYGRRSCPQLQPGSGHAPLVQEMMSGLAMAARGAKAPASATAALRCVSLYDGSGGSSGSGSGSGEQGAHWVPMTLAEAMGDGAPGSGLRALAPLPCVLCASPTRGAALQQLGDGSCPAGTEQLLTGTAAAPCAHFASAANTICLLGSAAGGAAGGRHRTHSDRKQHGKGGRAPELSHTLCSVRGGGDSNGFGFSLGAMPCKYTAPCALRPVSSCELLLCGLQPRSLPQNALAHSPPVPLPPTCSSPPPHAYAPTRGHSPTKARSVCCASARHTLASAPTPAPPSTTRCCAGGAWRS